MPTMRRGFPANCRMFVGGMQNLAFRESTGMPYGLFRSSVCPTMTNVRRSQPMPVKYWSFAGLMITYSCNARCASCYLACGPDRREAMPVDSALAVWQGLIAACPHGCRVHISGGEPFLDWPRLIDLCRRGKAMGLGPLEKVETNAFWADSDAIARERCRELDQGGMETLAISADPYHQQFVPLANCRRLAAAAAEVLGAGRVQVRWRDWLESGCDTQDLAPGERAELFARYAQQGRERYNGRAADEIAGFLPIKPVEDLSDSPCSESLLRGRHVHIDADLRVMPGTCAGIVLGRCGPQTVGEIWQRLNDNFHRRPIVGTLGRLGPAGLVPEAVAAGFTPRQGYAGKCHLCWDIRRFWSRVGGHGDELGPAWLYAQTSPD